MAPLVVLDAAGPLVHGEDRQLDPAGADEAFGRLQRLVTGCPSWDGPLGALVDMAWLVCAGAWLTANAPSKLP
jgi:hypothetical protein